MSLFLICLPFCLPACFLLVYIRFPFHLTFSDLFLPPYPHANLFLPHPELTSLLSILYLPTRKQCLPSTTAFSLKQMGRS